MALRAAVGLLAKLDRSYVLNVVAIVMLATTFVIMLGPEVIVGWLTARQKVIADKRPFTFSADAVENATYYHRVLVPDGTSDTLCA